MNEEALGALVRSKAGRDKGRSFTVVEVLDENHVRVADGDLRKLASPKKKKLRHLAVSGVWLPQVRAKLLSGAPLTDAELRKAISGACGGEARQNRQEG